MKSFFKLNLLFLLPLSLFFHLLLLHLFLLQKPLLFLNFSQFLLFFVQLKLFVELGFIILFPDARRWSDLILRVKSRDIACDLITKISIRNCVFILQSIRYWLLLLLFLLFLFHSWSLQLLPTFRFKLSSDQTIAIVLNFGRWLRLLSQCNFPRCLNYFFILLNLLVLLLF